MSENGNTKDNKAVISSENTGEVVPEIPTLTQKAVNEKLKQFITPSQNS